MSRLFFLTSAKQLFTQMKFFCIRFCFVIIRTNKIEQHKKTQHLFWIVENADKVCLLLISRIRQKTAKCRKSTLVDRRLSIRPKYNFSRKVFLNSQTFSQNQCASSSLAVIARILSLAIEHRIVVLSKNDCTFRTRVSVFSAGVIKS